MDFGFGDEQRALARVAADLFAQVSPPQRLRGLWDGAERGREVWQRLAAVGLTGIAVPEEHGGGGGDEVDLVLVLEEAGYAALPEPLLETAGVAVPALLEGGGDAHAEWLARIATGDALATVVLGTQPFAVDADVADLLVVEHGDALVALPREAWSCQPVAAVDRARRLFRVEVDAGMVDAGGVEAGGVDAGGGEVGGGARLGGAGAVRRARARAAAGSAALLIGIARSLLDRSVEHARTRHQFGVPIGSFQAVAHQLADAHAGVESARAAVWYAAYAQARDLPDRVRSASVAKAAASDAEHRANTVALQVHGGIGFAWEHDLHLWLKRGRALEQAYGSSREHRRYLAADLLEGTG